MRVFQKSFPNFAKQMLISGSLNEVLDCLLMME